MKRTRILIPLLALVLCVSMAACGGNSSGGGDAGTSGGDTAGTSSGGSGAEIAFIIPANQELGINDKGWIQNIWTAMSDWSAENGKVCTYYQTVDDSKQSHIDTYDLAIQNGAKVIYGCGNECLEAMRTAPWDYPDVSFISLEATGFAPDEIAPNLRAICTGQQESAWLAGVAAVGEGYTDLGIISCWDIPPINQWCWGYIQGVNYAAKRDGIEGITVRHHYANSASANPETQALAAAWYVDGVECIQCNAAGGNNSIIAAATAANKPVFGADADLAKEGPTVITSMVVDRTVVTYDVLTSIYDGTFDNNGGEEFWVGAAAGISRLSPWESNRFENYTFEQYQEDIAALANDTEQCRTGMITPDDAVDIYALQEQMGDNLVITINHII
ncbi:MAG: BMP family ABC transporter substrate-binding protein [Clostridiales Family XIII bacterium]|jgi:basic membrane protein A|nr:BMP family ABC transporter substrate-binding protein [Clostridiales Family XIII bacterium]